MAAQKKVKETNRVLLGTKEQRCQVNDANAYLKGQNTNKGKTNFNRHNGHQPYTINEVAKKMVDEIYLIFEEAVERLEKAKRETFTSIDAWIKIHQLQCVYNLPHLEHMLEEEDNYSTNDKNYGSEENEEKVSCSPHFENILEEEDDDEDSPNDGNWSDNTEEVLKDSLHIIGTNISDCVKTTDPIAFSDLEEKEDDKDKVSAYHSTFEGNVTYNNDAANDGIGSDDIEEVIKDNLRRYEAYISDCVKATDLIAFYDIFTASQAKTLRSIFRRNPKEATEQAFQEIRMKIHQPDKYRRLISALKDTGYPKIVQILEGVLVPVGSCHRDTIRICEKHFFQQLNTI